MKKALAIFAAIAAIVSCNSVDGYRIHGTVENPNLEGAIVFLVPVGEPVHEPSKDNLDSTFIHNQRFEFSGTKERLVDVRLERMKRLGTQNILLVTEPGDITVRLGKKSSCNGTPQNDSLQVWKEITEESASIRQAIRQAGQQELYDSLYNLYKKRTQSMALSLGEDSPAGEFLLKLYPIK